MVSANTSRRTSAGGSSRRRQLPRPNDPAFAEKVEDIVGLYMDTPERVRLMQLVDELNARHGRDRVRFACSGLDRGWKLKAESHSLRYTTRWSELLNV